MFPRRAFDSHMSHDPLPPSKQSFAARSWRVVWRWGRWPLLAWFVVVLVFYALQTILIFPGARTQGTAEARLLPPADTELVALTTPAGETIQALFGCAKSADGERLADPRQRPTLLFFYGNGDCLTYLVDEFERFRRLGVHVMIPDYVGYGLSTGRPSEQGCYDTASACYAWLKQRDDVTAARIVSGGWSLGGGVAIDLAAREPIAGVVAMCSFTSVGDVAAGHYPFLPIRWCLEHRFESLAKLPRVACPLFLAHGSRDRVVPYQMSVRLREAAGDRATLLTIEGADHNDFFMLGGDELLQQMGAWMRAR